MAEDANGTPETGESEENTPVENTDVEGYKALRAEVTEDEDLFEVRDQKYRLAEKIPGIVLLDLGLASDPNATMGEQLRAMRAYLQAAIHPADVERFNVFLHKADPVIEQDELNQIIEKLIERVAGRPTK